LTRAASRLVGQFPVAQQGVWLTTAFNTVDKSCSADLKRELLMGGRPGCSVLVPDYCWPSASHPATGGWRNGSTLDPPVAGVSESYILSSFLLVFTVERARRERVGPAARTTLFEPCMETGLPTKVMNIQFLGSEESFGDSTPAALFSEQETRRTGFENLLHESYSTGSLFLSQFKG